ncbi:restriction endonuclease subunit S [Novosphingobium sp. ES2-1]|uniref:restriction endonuclease subunit S n=1 Tax=Novosphingobium sp. ES2-1 TaxID=2780074 RepID=UPI001881C567|nr:restriction endonuclease subunit S [Novosphingobium sp. ES2-1]QOV94229.1 restriction endonuclease subunit S [Novosphingobium sp. ES2-1]
MSFPAYPEYKDSRVDWLGEVPSHWKVTRLKNSIDDCRNGIWGDEALGDENDVICIRVADFQREKALVDITAATFRNVREQDRQSRLVTNGDLLLEKSGGGEKQLVGAVVRYTHNEPAICSNFVAKVKIAPEMSGTFWAYVHAAAYAVRLNYRSIKQTSGIQNLDQSQYFDELAAFPPLIEQTAIATFLDRETAKIDALVAEQERLIALLKEKRQAVISHAVTRGLNPNAPMKDSGIEWLGEIPAHWVVAPLKRIAIVLAGYAFSAAEFSADSENWRLLRGINLSASGIRWNEDTVFWQREADDGLENWELGAGDIVLGMDRPWIGDGLRVAEVTESDLPCLLLQRVSSTPRGSCVRR